MLEGAVPCTFFVLCSWTMHELRNRPFYSCLLSDLPLNGSEAGGDLALIQTDLSAFVV